MVTDYDELISELLNDPEGGFRAALGTQDPIALALAGVLDPDMGGPRAAARFGAFADSRGPDQVTSALALGILANARQLSDELVEGARAFVGARWKDLALSEVQGERVAAMVRDRQVPDARRMSLLLWLWGARPRGACEVAGEILSDEAEPYGATVRQAITILASNLSEKTRALLRQYAARQFGSSPAPPPAPQPNPEASLYVLNHLGQVGEAEMELVLEVLGGAAERALSVADQLDHLCSRLTLAQVRGIVEFLSEQGQADWLSEALLPALLRLRGRDLAETADEEWWPEECLPVIAEFEWRTVDDSLYVTVLKRIHRTTHEASRAKIRAAVRARCEATTPNGAGRMPRLGVRGLLELCLQGQIGASDADLVAALSHLGSDGLIDEIRRVGWKKPDRSQRLAAVIGSVDPQLVPRVFAMALDAGSATAIAFLEGVPGSALDEHAAELAGLSEGKEAVLTRLCSLSEEAASLTMERWAEHHTMVDFRALAQSSRSEARLEAIPEAVRSYAEVSSEDRAELLRTLNPTEERLDLLLAVLADRRNPPGSAPSQVDLIGAIGLLAEHLREGGDGRTLEALQGICREVTQASVRRAAYAALAEAVPTAELVDLLLERRDGEVPALRPAVKEALSRLADKLEVEAQDEASTDRAVAIAQLARIEPGRAAAYARDLLQAPDAHDRRVAAEILGETGKDEDAALLEAAVEHEPDPDVRKEFHRAMRRLRIGDLAAAHERIGELAGIDAPAWAAADPKELFEQWTDPLVTGLNRIAQAETNEDWGTAIDQLNEVAKALLFRAIELAGGDIGIKQPDIVAAATNSLDYGSVVGRQHLQDNWRWVRHLAALYELRTEHIAKKGRVEAPAERTPQDWIVAQRLFKLAAGECCRVILESERVSP